MITMQGIIFHFQLLYLLLLCVFCVFFFTSINLACIQGVFQSGLSRRYSVSGRPDWSPLDKVDLGGKTGLA